MGFAQWDRVRRTINSVRKMQPSFFLQLVLCAFLQSAEVQAPRYRQGLQRRHQVNKKATIISSVITMSFYMH